MDKLDKERFLKRLQSDPAFLERTEKWVARQLLESVFQTAVSRGDISIKGKSQDQILEEFRKYLTVEKLRTVPFRYAINYTETLRALGRDFLEKNQPWITVLMYSTWVEHTLNFLISVGLERRGFGDATVKQVIRDVSLAGKLSWLLPVLGFRAIHSGHRDTLKALADKRNEFVHYKWPYRKDHSDAELRTSLSQIEKTLRYLAQYVTRETLSGGKSRIAKAVHSSMGAPKQRAKG